MSEDAKTPRPAIEKFTRLCAEFSRRAGRMSAQETLDLIKDIAAVREAATFEALQLAKEEDKTEKAAAKKDWLLRATTSKHNFLFLIDASGSMTASYDASGSLLVKTLSSVESAYIAFTLLQRAAVSGAFWGDSAGIAPFSAQDLADPAKRKKLKQGLSCSTDLCPTLDDLLPVSAEIAGSKKSLHLYIVSDGDLYDAEKSEKALKTMLASSPRLTVDFVVFSTNSGSQMEKMVQRLQKDYPQQVGLKKIAATGEITNPLFEIIGARMKSPKAKRTRKPAPGKYPIP